MVVVDYGAGNIGSVLNMIQHVGGQAQVAKDKTSILRARKILLPGVGSFDNAMTRLTNLDLIEPLKEQALSGVPILGICLGMQLLGIGSEEGHLPGMGLISGSVRRFRFEGELSKLKVPHMGWNRVQLQREHPLAHGLESDARFYFVHSYYFDCEHPEDVLFKSIHGHEFDSGIQRNNIMGVQFHPEKSHRFGMRLIQNFVRL